MAEFEAVMRTAGWAAAVLFVLLLVVRCWWMIRTRHSRMSLSSAPAWLVALQIVRASVLTLLGLGVLSYLLVFQRGTVFMPAPLQGSVTILVLAYVIFEIGTAGWPRRLAYWKHGVGAAGLVAAGSIGILLGAGAVHGFRHPATEDGVVFEQLPFDGEWVAIGAGASSITNHHDRVASQKYAADLAALCNDGRLFHGGGDRLEDSCTFGRPIYSPVDGIVTHSEDGHRDGASRSVLPGNHVIIRFAPDRHVALAHLREGTVRVRTGELVKAGQEIGQAGNSGNSDFAHLHIHVQDSPVYDMANSRAFPYRFATMERRRYLWWSKVTNGFLLSNDRVRPA